MTIAQASPAQGSIRYVKGVGPHRLGQLAQLGIETVEDACYYAPRRYEDRTHLAAIGEARAGQVLTVRGRVLAVALRRIRRGQTLFEATVGDATGAVQAVWFNQPYLAQQVRVDEDVILYGEVQARPRLQMVHPELERVEAGEAEHASVHLGRIVPVYPMTAGLSQRWFRETMAGLLDRHSRALPEVLPAPLRQEHGWPGVAEAARELHFPSSWATLDQARQRLAFEECFVFQTALALRRAGAVRLVKAHRYQVRGGLADELQHRLPFTLTAAQERVLAELLVDLERPAPMRRLLQGEVGCGKTIVMAVLIAAAVDSGYQVALMAPTELLAEQHARVLAGYFKPLGVTVTLLSQGIPSAARAKAAAAIAAGQAGVVVGTQALIQRGIAFNRLALVIIDEQHKFGVAQRALLARKGDLPDVLVVTATPIPRTLALSLYGDLDISTITELPSGRRPVITRRLGAEQRQEAYELIRQELAQGRQAYVVYPVVEERSTRELRAATQMAKQLQAQVFPSHRVGLLHGQMRPAIKEQTMRAFAEGRIDVLVSTVIVEVGLDVPNATLMLIEHPERFGLAQLHQLRGRIGRGAHQASCLILSDAAEGPVRERLQAFVDCLDGFELAEQDLQQRGPGELLGRRQHGWLRFRIANLARDRLLLELARQAAQVLVAEHPTLAGPELSPLRERLARLRQAAGAAARDQAGKS